MLASFREWTSVTFARVNYQKSFIGDQDFSHREQDKHIRRARELKDRAIQLHLDELEENYLCCACGTSGESRESEDHIYETFFSVKLPSREIVRDAMEAGECDDELPSRRTRLDTSFMLEREETVSPLEIEHMMYKIRHAVLRNESRTKRKAVAIHRDKGLMMIEEDDINVFTNFFRRPVKGYLCETCYTSARTRLDLLRRQIELLLFKAKHPFLRRLFDADLHLLFSSGQISQYVFDAVLRAKHGEEKSDSVPSTVSPFITSQHAPSSPKKREKKCFLTNKCITNFRTSVKCGVCENRLCSFFVRSSVLFLCQYCCARDRYYRENAICINDEKISGDDCLLLMSLSGIYERSREESGLMHHQLSCAPTSLFEHSESLFSKQIGINTMKHQWGVPPVNRISKTDLPLAGVVGSGPVTTDFSFRSSSSLFSKPYPSLFTTMEEVKEPESCGEEIGFDEAKEPKQRDELTKSKIDPIDPIYEPLGKALSPNSASEKPLLDSQSYPTESSAENASFLKNEVNQAH